MSGNPVGSVETAQPQHRVSAVVISRNDGAHLARCLTSLLQDMASLSGTNTITVVLNGCRDGSLSLAQRIAATAPLPVHVHSLPLGDKANAINEYIHRFAPVAAMHVFVDGYAAVAPGSLAALRAALQSDPKFNAATGLPTQGRSAAAAREQLARLGGLHGSLHALRGGFVERLQQQHLHLPIGLYRGDGLMGSMAVWDLDPLAGHCDIGRVAMAPAATWTRPEYRLSDAPRLFRRRIRQKHGFWEVFAIQQLILQGGYAALPRCADEMLRDFLRDNAAMQPRWNDVFGQLALRQVRRGRLTSGG